jgi:hypothetical protein
MRLHLINALVEMVCFRIVITGTEKLALSQDAFLKILDFPSELCVIESKKNEHQMEQ